tara:strand:- start:107 stop:667 length:561 start_codon:yes stop_codon:yes gene_type:complete
MDYKKESFTFKVIEYYDEKLNLKYKKYIKVLVFYKEDCILIFNFPPFKYEDDNNNVEGVYLSIKAKIGNIVKHDLDSRYTYHVDQNKNIKNKERKNISFQLKINNFNKLLKEVIAIFITYYQKEYNDYPEFLINKRVTGNSAKNKGEKMYCYNLKIYRKKNKLLKNKKYKLIVSYKEDLKNSIISD